jgi:hypothetical protein
MHHVVCRLFVCVWYLKALPFGGAFYAHKAASVVFS